MATIEEFAVLVPESLLDRPGEIFHSGRLAFESHSDLYILSKQSGAGREDPSSTLVRSGIERILHYEPDNWCAYRDATWGGRPPGTAPMQQGMLHLFNELGVDPGTVPAAHLVFACAKRGEMSQDEFQQLARDCWPFHQAVIEQLGVRVIACLGKDVSNWVRDRLSVSRLVEEFTENNDRKWKNRTFANGSLSVIELTYPGIAKWAAPATDPTGLVQRALERSSRQL